MERPRPRHEPDPYSTPPYGEPGPWAPAPPVQHPVATPAHGTHVPPHHANPPHPGMTPAHGTTMPAHPMPGPQPYPAHQHPQPAAGQPAPPQAPGAYAAQAGHETQARRAVAALRPLARAGGRRRAAWPGRGRRGGAARW